MEKLSAENLKEIIDNHGRWLRNKEGGIKANLCGANLCDADLRDANLCGANLCGANLCGANLCDANLCGANLCDANLCDANLCDANLCGANLCGANLCDADLCDADLRDANLCDANLCGADLCGANLCGANLSKQIIQVGPIGSRKSQTIYNVTDNIVQCGCWNNYKGGTLEEFELRVANEYGAANGKYFKEYMNVIGYFKSLRDVSND
jgi:uncharacterized protein YjbI with pentapeptide repeats